MKSGASDPFADDSSHAAENEESASESPPTESTDADGEPESAASANAAAEPPENQMISKEDLPLLLRRDTVKGERENVHQLFVQADTDTKARQAENELSERLDTDVYRLDAREAIYLAGMQNLADAADILKNWGYNF